MRRCRSLLLLLTAIIAISAASMGGSTSAVADDAPPPSSIDSALQRKALLTSLDALLLRLDGKLDAAIARYQEAVALYREAKDGEGAAHTLNDIGAVYEQQGDYPAALARRQEALAGARTAGSKQVEGDALKGIGQLYYRLGQYGQARDKAREAITLAQQIEASALARGDALAGVVAESLEGVALATLGQSLEGLGDYAAALQAQQRRLAIARDRITRARAGEEGISLDANIADEYQSLNSIGSVLAGLGRFDEALDYFTQAFNGAVATGDGESAAVYQNNIAFALAAQGHADQALGLLTSALASIQQRGDRYSESVVLNNIGSTYRDTGRLDQSLDYYRRSLELARALGDRAGECVSLNNIGTTHQAQGDFAAARDDYNKALFIARETGSRAFLQTILNNLASLAEKSGALEEALGFRLEAISVAEDIRTLARIDEFRSSLAADAATAYQKAVSLLMRLGRPEDAFNLTERARSRSFLDQIGSSRPDLARGGDPGLLSQESALRTEIGALDVRLRTEQAKRRTPAVQESINAISQQLSTQQRAYDDLLSRLKLSDAETASLVSVDPLSLRQVQNLLDGQTTLLSYYVTPQATYAFIVGRSTFRAVELPVAETDLRKANTELRDLSTVKSSVLPPPSMTRLYAQLIAPLADSLVTPGLRIAPHGILNSIPFAALSDGTAYFGAQHTISYLPSASTLPFIQAKRKQGSGDPFVMAEPHAEGLPLLRYATAEATAIADQFNVAPLLGDQATESALQANGGDHRIIHIAAHGELESNAPLFSRVYLEPDSRNDGILTVGEVYRLSLKRTDLVILSACETQLGLLTEGDDLIGLNRAFIYAGSASVIASLWSVNDKATSVLMTSFYRHLGDGMSKAEALQAAQADTRAQFPHPFYWAAFVLTGDPGGPSR